MKTIKFALPLLLLFALGFMLSGCPKNDKMMQNEKAPTAVSQTLVG